MNRIDEGNADEVDEEEVRRIAELARVEVDDDEVEEFVEEFNDVLGYFDTLDEVDDEVEASDDLENVMRSDEVEESLPRDEVLRNAPETEDGYVKGPTVSE